MVRHMVHHMVQDMMLDILPILIILDLDPDVGDSKEAHQGSHHTLMVPMGHHMVILMVPLMVIHMVLHMVPMEILEAPTMAIGKMVPEDKILEIMETEEETFKVARMILGVVEVALNNKEKRILVEETRT